MSASAHIPDTDLALYATGDIALWRQPVLHLHIARCESCRARVDDYQADQHFVRRTAAELPQGLPWERMAAEMTANIRVGLEAGECVARRREKRALSNGWRAAIAMAGFSALLMSAWWLNMPASQSASLGRAVKKIAQASPWRGRGILALEDRGPSVEVSSAGIQLRENGGVLGVSQGVARPISVTLSVQGSARARYLDLDTGQITITSVYAQ